MIKLGFLYKGIGSYTYPRKPFYINKTTVYYIAYISYSDPIINHMNIKTFKLSHFIMD